MADRRTLRWLLIAIAACFALYLVGNNSVPLWDRDEGWYAQCSRQMWETGDWVVPRYLDGLRTEKPVLVYWLHMGGYWLFGGPSEFAVRFYSAVAQTLVLCILGYGLWRMAGPKRALWTVLAYGTCLMAVVSAKTCLTDATLMVFVVLAQLCLLAIHLGYFTWARLLLMFVALGFATLTKGPIALMPSAATAAALLAIEWRRWMPAMAQNPARFCKRLGQIGLLIAAGLGVVSLVCLPWLVLLHLREPRWLPAVLGIAYQHLTTPAKGHAGPFGYYLAFIWITFFPWALLLIPAGIIAWKQRHIPQVRFAAAAIIGPWFVLDAAMRTKLPHYMLPTYPFVALLVADCIVRCARGQYSVLSTRGFVRWVAIWALPVGLLMSAPWLALLPAKSLGALPYAAMATLSVLGFVFTVGTWWHFRSRRILMACAWLGGGFIVLLAVGYGWYLPECNYLRTNQRLAALLAQCDGLANKAKVGEVATLLYYPKGKESGYVEPTLTYYQGGTIREIEIDRYLERTPIEKWPRVMVMPLELWQMLEPATRQHLRQVGIVRGLQYNRGRIVDVVVAVKV